jgi:two-component system cell cycle sensor histidine kinase/response regulator CckA
MAMEEGQEERIAALEAEVRRLQVMLESAPEFISRITNQGNFLYVNRVMPGFTREQVLGTSIEAYIPPEFRERAQAAMRAARESRSVQQFATAGPVAADRLGYYLTRVSPVIEAGEVTSLVMIATDVSALEEQRVLTQVALDATGLGTWTYNPGAQAGSWDEATCKIFGAPAGSPAPPFERLLQQYIHPEDRELILQGLATALSTGRFGPLEYRIVRAGGEVRWVSASGLAMKNAQGNPGTLVGSLQDITEHRALEARLLEAQKLESIGRLAGGVAHDFNNMLTAILGNVDFAADAASPEEVQPLLAEIRLTAERSAALTAQLLAFARRQVIAPKVVDPNALIQRVDALFRRLIGEQIRVTLSFAARGLVRVDESQLEQVIMNLVTNARDAMAEGGSLRVETSDVVLDQRYADGQLDVTPGPYVAIAVVDSGPGIPAAALPHIFEPFYTTRSRGTGLGLATCYGIVKQSGGHIVVNSELGQGTAFRVYLPRVEAELPRAAASPAAPTATSGERVLLVEDEPSVRAVAERALGRHGYLVRSVGTAEEALRVASSEPAFALLVTDVVLPGMSGRDLARQLTQSWPKLCVLFISGYTQNTIEHGGVLDPGISFLQKPFLPLELLVAARKVLGRTEPGQS